jgi:tellurite resistance protein
MSNSMKLSEVTADAMARGLVTVATVDGMNVSEKSLIEQFWREHVGGTNVPALQNRDEISASELRDSLGFAAERELFMKTALVLCFADGTFSLDEKRKLNEYASALGIGQRTLNELSDSAKQWLASRRR